MKRQEVIDRLKALVGGIATDESIPNDGYLLSKLNSLREFAIAQLFKREGIDDPANYMDFYCEYDEDLQDDAGCGYTLFRVPPPIQLSSDRSGFSTGATDKGLDIILHVDDATWKTYLMHPLTKALNRVNAVYNYATGIMKVQGEVRSFTVSMIPKTPEDIPTWNPEKDEYPMGGQTLEMLEEMYKNGALQFMLRIPANKVSNGTEDAKMTEQMTKQ